MRGEAIGLPSALSPTGWQFGQLKQATTESLDRLCRWHDLLRHNDFFRHPDSAMTANTFLATFGLVGLRLLELHGVDRQRLVAGLGIASPAPQAHDRLPSTLVDRGFELACAQIDDPAFALRAASCWHPSNLGTLGYAWLSSGTLRTGLRRLVRYSRTLGTQASCRCVDEPQGLRFIFDPQRGATDVGYVIADFWLALLLDLCRTNYGASLQPLAVSLRRPQPADSAPYRDFFGCAVDFGAAEDSFVLARDVVDAPLPTANQALAATFDVILAEQLAALDEADLATRCKGYLLQQLTSGTPAENDLASALGMSRRSLQRRLGELGASYQQLLDETRYGLARRYLDSATKNVTEIAFLLGFSEQSAFCRAFKRWSGRSPTAYRVERSGAA